MKQTMLGVLATLVSATAVAQTTGFTTDVEGGAPAGWTCGVTGRGSPIWGVVDDPTSSTGKVLLQSGRGTFPWCVKDRASVTDGFVEVAFRPIAGREDQAGGVVWRWKDGDNYYVARANALENNVSLYHTERGNRRTIRYVDAPVARERWHVLRVEFAGTRIAISLDGRRFIEASDGHLAGPGSVGVWTKADSVTAFKDFAYGAAAR